MKELVWTQAARADLDRIADHYEQLDRRVGEALVDRVEAAAGGLRRRDTGRPGRIPGTREKGVPKSNYILIYEVHDKAVIVFRAIHTAQNWPAG